MPHDARPAPARPPIPWRRRAFHLTTGLAIPAVALTLGYGAAVAVAATAAGALAATEALRLAVPAVNRLFVAVFDPILKPRELRAVTAATYLALASIASLLLFGTPIAALALLYGAVGDPAAGVVGARYGVRRWRAPHRTAPDAKGKTVEGTLAFLAACLVVATALWAAGVHAALPAAMAGAAVAAAVEALPDWLEDNAAVPLAGAAAMWLLWPG